MAQKAKKTTIFEAAVVGMCFNATKTLMACSPNNDVVHIVLADPKVDCSEWQIVHTLRGHEQAISAIDWCPVTNKILTCGHDRTAFVWSQEKEDSPIDAPWKPTLVLLDTGMKHGFTSCKFAMSGQKIYVGCASNTVAVGKYDAETDWWRCLVYEPHCSSVTCMEPSPAVDTLLATGSTDCTVKVASTFVKSVDAAEARLGKIGTELAVFDVKGWVNALAWNDEGTALAVASHDSTVTIFCGESPTDFSGWGAHFITMRQLPLRSLTFINDSTVVAGGHDFYPVALTYNEEAHKWAATKTGAKAKGAATEKLSETQLARMRFQNQSSLGTTASVELPQTRHTSTIVGVRRVGTNKFATASLDGRVEFWDVNALEPIA
eukprot:CAMPEP_0174853704 /NCGR_PEP_ID=MMETSP1114-20130205/29528_1 /TAXON_ID=312471 /ORGANISM="Neobodo designis, Strain CCAP 1951/1" /LENGTH=376 /DNA_ID=CAMNT_0016088367 /DNA_START=97 /DNA_END=1227 /DNA_ORIENTATION=+